MCLGFGYTHEGLFHRNTPSQCRLDLGFPNTNKKRNNNNLLYYNFYGGFYFSNDFSRI